MLLYLMLLSGAVDQRVVGEGAQRWMDAQRWRLHNGGGCTTTPANSDGDEHPGSPEMMTMVAVVVMVMVVVLMVVMLIMAMSTPGSKWRGPLLEWPPPDPSGSPEMMTRMEATSDYDDNGSCTTCRWGGETTTLAAVHVLSCTRALITFSCTSTRCFGDIMSQPMPAKRLC